MGHQAKRTGVRVGHATRGRSAADGATDEPSLSSGDVPGRDNSPLAPDPKPVHQPRKDGHEDGWLLRVLTRSAVILTFLVNTGDAMIRLRVFAKRFCASVRASANVVVIVARRSRARSNSFLRRCNSNSCSKAVSRAIRSLPSLPCPSFSSCSNRPPPFSTSPRLSHAPIVVTGVHSVAATVSAPATLPPRRPCGQPRRVVHCARSNHSKPAADPPGSLMDFTFGPCRSTG